MRQLSLLGDVTQRWRARRATYRPAGEPIDTRRHEVAFIDDDHTAKEYVLAHHYSGSYPAARFRVGLYARARLVGVAVFSHPCNERVLSVLPTDRLESVELGRFVLDDQVAANGETWFLGRAFELLRREGLRGVVSFSDPVPRTRLDGTVLLPGHVGVIYQAHNAVYLGRGTSRTLRLLPDGRVLSDRALSKIRARERGWRYAAEQLVAHGAAPLAGDADAAAWLAAWVSRLTRRLPHRGCHKYVWALEHALRRHLPPGRPYPKVTDALGAGTPMARLR